MTSLDTRFENSKYSSIFSGGARKTIVTYKKDNYGFDEPIINYIDPREYNDRTNLGDPFYNHQEEFINRDLDQPRKFVNATNIDEDLRLLSDLSKSRQSVIPEITDVTESRHFAKFEQRRHLLEEGKVPILDEDKYAFRDSSQEKYNNNFAKYLSKDEYYFPQKEIITGVDQIANFLARHINPGLGSAFRDFCQADHKGFRTMGTYANLLGIAINSAFVASAKRLPEGPIKDTLNFVGNQAYRSFLLNNNVLNVINGLRQNKPILAIGDLIDIPLIFTHVKDMYAARMLYFGVASLDSALQMSSNSPLRPKNGGSYTSMQDAFQASVHRLKEFPAELLKDWQSILGDKDSSFGEKLHRLRKESLFNSKKATMGIMGGISYLAAFASYVTGNKKVARIIGDLISCPLIAADRLNPKRLLEGRFFSWLAAAVFTTGVMADYLGFTKLQMLGYSLGRVIKTEAVRQNESNNDNLKPVANPLTNPKQFALDALERLGAAFNIYK